MITRMTASQMREINEETVFTYACVESEIADEESGFIRTYGIEMRMCAKNASESVLLLLIPDISTDREQIQRLVEWMDKLQIHPVHVEDVIEDFLYDLSVE